MRSIVDKLYNLLSGLMLSSNVSFAWIGTQIEGENSLFPGSGGFNIETFTNIVKIFLIFITILLDNDLL